MPSQQVTTESAPMKEVERTNMIVVRELGQGMETLLRRDLYVIEVDRGRNCYACRGFGHIAHHCRNQWQRGRVAKRRRLEYEGRKIKGINEHLDHLKGVENLESLDQILSTNLMY